MNTSTLRLVIASLACAFVLGLVGCEDGARLKVTNNEVADNNGSQGPGGEDDSTDDQEEPGQTEEEEEVEPGPTDEEGHGISEEEQEYLEPGYMSGSWRAATGEQDQPVAYFDTFHDEGDTEVTGTFLMGFAVYERLDGETGELEEASFDGDQLTLSWNPTNDSEELFTLQASRVDEDTLDGRVTAQRNVELDLPVTLTRQKVE